MGQDPTKGRPGASNPRVTPPDLVRNPHTRTNPRPGITHRGPNRGHPTPTRRTPTTGGGPTPAKPAQASASEPGGRSAGGGPHPTTPGRRRSCPFGFDPARRPVNTPRGRRRACGQARKCCEGTCLQALLAASARRSLMARAQGVKSASGAPEAPSGDPRAPSEAPSWPSGAARRLHDRIPPEAHAPPKPGRAPPPRTGAAHAGSAGDQSRQGRRRRPTPIQPLWPGWAPDECGSLENAPGEAWLGTCMGDRG